MTLEKTLAIPSDVLVIEDNVTLVAFLAAVYAGRVVGVATLAEGLARIRERSGHWPFVVLDLHLPDSPLAATIAGISSLKRMISGKLVVMTGYPVDTDELLLRGADVVVSKADNGFASALMEALDVKAA